MKKHNESIVKEITVIEQQVNSRIQVINNQIEKLMHSLESTTDLINIMNVEQQTNLNQELSTLDRSLQSVIGFLKYSSAGKGAVMRSSDHTFLVSQANGKLVIDVVKKTNS